MTDLTAVFAAWADHLGIVHTNEAAPDIVDDEGFDVPGPLWDGTRLYTADLASPQDWAHEIAHWAGSDPKRRTRANYGLGEDWLYGFASWDPCVSVKNEEYAASVLGICWLRSAGGDWKSEALDHHWVALNGTLSTEWRHYELKVSPWISRFDKWLPKWRTAQGRAFATAVGVGA